MFKRTLITRLVSVMLALVLAGNSVSVAFAAGGKGDGGGTGDGGCGCRVVRTEKLNGGLELRHIVDKNGVEYRVATKTEKYGDGNRMLFWVIQNDAQLQSLQDAVGQMGSSSGKGAGLAAPSASIIGILGGGWIYYTSTTIQIYISHDDAVMWVSGFAIIALICACIMAVPVLVWAGLLCTFMAGMSGIVVNDYDSRGAPGFYINVTKTPLRVWLSP